MCDAIGSLRTIVCDQGSAFLKLGYATENEPTLIVPSVFSKDGNGTVVAAQKALQTKNHQRIMLNGIVQDWDGIEKLWTDAFSSLSENGGLVGSKILMAEQTTNQVINRKEILERFFEKFQFGAVNLSNEAMLCLYSHGLSTGLVVDVGFESTRLTPIYNGYISQHTSRRLNYGGEDVSKYLLNLLSRRGYHMYSKKAIDVVDQIKEQLCYTALNLEKERALALETTVLVEKFTVPDGTNLKVGQERFEATEALFDPNLIDLDCRGLSKSIFDTIQSSDMDCRADLLRNIVVCGGSSLLPDFRNRIESDVKEIFLDKTLKGDESRLKKYQVNVRGSSRNHQVFLGGSVLSELMNDNPDFWITKRDYEEEGLERIISKIYM